MHISPRFKIWPLCQDHTCVGCESSFYFRSHESIRLWLQGFKTDPSVMSHLRSLLHQYENTRGYSQFSDDDVIEQAVGMIASGRLRICSRTTQNAVLTESVADKMSAAEYRVIRNLRMMARNFLFEGRQYRIIRALQWFSEYADDDCYQIIPQPEARKLLEKMATGPTLSPDEKTALQEAAALVPNTNNRFYSGILLLRIVHIAHVSRTTQEPAVTPSQLARYLREEKEQEQQKQKKQEKEQEKEKEQHWIEIKLVGEDGIGIAGEAYWIVTPDNKEFSGKTDANGWARLDKIVEGQCKISFPNLDVDDWRAI